jgi:hypothetical protein
MHSKLQIPYPRKPSLIGGDGKHSKLSVPKLIRPTARAQADGEARNVMERQLDRGVDAMEDHPGSFLYMFDDVLHKTLPDLKVWLRSGAIEVHEVKFKTKRYDLELNRRLDAIERAYEEVGIVYRRFFSDDFERQPRRSNIDLVFRYRENAGAEAFLEAATEAVLARPGITFRELSAATGIDLPSFLALVFDNHFGIDLDAPIGADMLVMP